jgi:uncharacterized protein DUF4349
MLVAAAAALALAACAKPHNQTYSEEKEQATLIHPASPAPAPTAAAGASGAATETDVATSTPKPPAAPSNAVAAPSPAATPMLAYAYDYAVEAPPSRIRGLVARRVAECAAAGPARCQVVGSNVSEQGKDEVTARLELKATPGWLAGFADRIAKDASDVGGRLTNQTVTSEDLSRQIVDTEAAVRAKTALRDRLQSLLETRPGSLQDLLKVEEELANVQGDLDATNSELAAMRERIATSDVTIEFSSAGVLSPQGAWSPVPHAISDFSGILAASIAAMIYVIAFAAPWLLVIGLPLWIFRKRIFRRRASTPPKPLDIPKPAP